MKVEPVGLLLVTSKVYCQSVPDGVEVILNLSYVEQKRNLGS